MRMRNVCEKVPTLENLKEKWGCGQKVGLQREATECTQKSRKKWRSENMSDWDR